MALLSPQVLDELLIEILLDLFDDFDHYYLKPCFCFLLCIMAPFSPIFSNHASSHALVLGISLFYFLFMCVYRCLCVCSCACRCSTKPEEGAESPGARLAGGGESLEVSAINRSVEEQPAS